MASPHHKMLYPQNEILLQWEINIKTEEHQTSIKVFRIKNTVDHQLPKVTRVASFE